MPADQPAPEAAEASTRKRSRTVAAGTTPAPRASATVPDSAAAKKAPAKKVAAAKAAPTAAAKGGRAKPTVVPSPGTGEGGAVLTAVAPDDSAVAVLDPGTEGLKLDETVVAGPDGPAVEAGAAEEEAAAEGGDF